MSAVLLCVIHEKFKKSHCLTLMSSNCQLLCALCWDWGSIKNGVNQPREGNRQQGDHMAWG